MADGLPIGRRGVLGRLHQLADTETLAHKKIGGRSIVWWLFKTGDEIDRARFRRQGRRDAG